MPRQLYGLATGTVSNSNFSGTFGNTFTVGSSDITVSSLGAFLDPAANWNSAKNVFIFNSSGTSVASVVIATTDLANSIATKVGQFVIKPITPVTLSAGASYTVATYGYGGDKFNANKQPNGVVVTTDTGSGLITTTGGGVYTGSANAYPTTAGGENAPGYGAPTFVYDVASSISVTPSTASVAVGGTTTLTATASSGSPTITWTSSDTSKATVNSSGVVTGVAAGTVTITASSSGYTSGTASVTVGVSLAITVPTVTANDSTGITVAATISGGTGPYTATLYRSASAPFTPPGTGTVAATYTGSTVGLSLKDTAPGTGPVYYRIVVTDSAGSPATVTTIVNANQVALFARRKLSPIFVGFIGDSITYGTGGSGTTGVQYFAANLAKVRSLLPITTNNQGISGTTSGDWVAGGTNYNGAVSAMATAISGMSPAAASKIVMIQLGTNDAKTANAFSKATYKSNISGIASGLVALGYTVILNAPLWIVPGSYSQWDEAANGRIASYRDAMLELDNGTTIKAGFMFGLEYYQLNPSQLNDGVHPNDAGYQTLGQAWAAEFDRIVYGSGVGAVLLNSLNGGLL